MSKENKTPAPGSLGAVTDLAFVCANCIHWAAAAKDHPQLGPVTIGEKQRGVCWGVPPTPVAVVDHKGNVTGQRHLRPMPMADERACALFGVAEARLPGVANDS